MFYSPLVGFSLLACEVSWSHTTTRHIRWDSSERMISPSQGPLPDNKQHSQQTNTHVPGGIRTHNLSRRAATGTGKWPQLLKIFNKQSLWFPLFIFKTPNHNRSPVLFIRSCAGLWHFVLRLGDTNLSENNTNYIFKWTECGIRILYFLKVSVTSYQVTWCHNSGKHNTCFNCRGKIKFIALINLLFKKDLFSVTPLFLGAFTKLRKATISFVMSVCPSVRQHGTIRLPLDGFSWSLIYEHFSKVCRENSNCIKIWQE